MFHYFPDSCDEDLIMSLLQRKDVCSFQHLSVFLGVAMLEIKLCPSKENLSIKEEAFVFHQEVVTQTLTEATWKRCELALLQSVPKSRHQQV